MQVKYLVFDFDGTIVVSMPLLFDILNKLAEKEGYKKIETREIEVYRNQGAREIIKKLGIPFYKIPGFTKLIRKQLELRIDEVEPVANLKQVVTELKRAGWILGILTSNSKNSVEKFFSKYNFDIFDFIYSGSSLFGKAKVIAKLIKNKGITKDQIIYVGDETRDVEAAHEAGIKVVAVTWGYNAYESFKAVKPDWLINKPEELLSTIGMY